MHHFDVEEVRDLIESALFHLEHDRYERSKTDAMIAIAETLFNFMLYRYPMDIAIHQSMKDDLLKGEQ
jgi:hypothetical protein